MSKSFLIKPNYIRIYGHRGARGDIVENSIEGNDYDNPKIENDSFPRVWNKDKRYRPYFNEWSKRPEYKNWVKKIN